MDTWENARGEVMASTEHKLSDILWMYDPFFGPNYVQIFDQMHVRIPLSQRILMTAEESGIAQITD